MHFLSRNFFASRFFSAASLNRFIAQSVVETRSPMDTSNFISLSIASAVLITVAIEAASLYDSNALVKYLFITLGGRMGEPPGN